MEDFLTETEAALLAEFAVNEELKEAVKKVLCRNIYQSGVIGKGKKHQANINFALGLTPAWNASKQQVTPAEIGLSLMVKAEALALLEDSFQTISDMKKVVTKVNQNNIAK